MSGILPPNLIHTSASEINDADAVELSITNSQILHRFWKVHAVQSDVIQDTASVRSRNLFWRVWSCPHLAESITSAQLNNLWQQFSQHVDLTPIHIDPAFWDRQRTFLSENPSTEDSGTTSINTSSSPQPSPSRYIDGDVSQAQLELPWSTSNNNSGPSPKLLARRSSSSKGKIPVPAASAKGKTRPTAARRKSSQTTKTLSSNSNRLVPPALRSPRKESAQISVIDSVTKEKGVSDENPTFNLPPSSWEDDFSSEHPSQQPSLHEPSGILIDRNFRGKFAEQLASSTNLPAMGRSARIGSVVRFADDLPLDQGKGKERERASISTADTDNIARKRSSVGSEVLSDESDSEGLQLPRTKSSLSLLIKDMRKRGGSQNLPPTTLVEKNPDRGREARTKEEELLSMGRKAGAASSVKMDTDAEYRYRSPSPGAQF